MSSNCRFFKIWRDILNFSADSLQRSQQLSGEFAIVANVVKSGLFKQHSLRDDFPNSITCSVASPWSSHFNVKARSTQDKKDNSIYNIYIYISSFEFLFFSSCCFSLFFRKVTSFLKLYFFPHDCLHFYKKDHSTYFLSAHPSKSTP